MEKEKDEHLFTVGPPGFSWKWRAEIAEGTILRREWLMYLWTQERLCCSLGVHTDCTFLALCTTMSWWMKLSSSWRAWCVKCILNKMSSTVRSKAVSPISPTASKSHGSDSGKLLNCVLSSLYTVHMLQEDGGMEVQRGNFSFKWEIQPSSFRKVNAQRESQCSHISVHTDWLSKAFDLLEKLLPRDPRALRGKKGAWIDICSLCRTNWLISGLIQMNVHPHHKPVPVADFHRTLLWQFCFSIKINVLHKSRIWYYKDTVFTIWNRHYSAFQGVQFPGIAADGAVLLSGSQRKQLSLAELNNTFALPASPCFLTGVQIFS